MTETEVRTVFSRYIVDDQIVIYPDTFVPISTFVDSRYFGDVSLTYDDLVARDGGVMGYKAFFDRAKAEGVLN